MGKGSININVHNINLTGRSNLLAGVLTNASSLKTQAGDINLNAANDITIIQESGIANQVTPGTIGNSGRISITTSNLSLTQGGRITTANLGQGNTGTININALDTISIDGVSQNSIPTAIASQVTPGAIGNSGGINLTTTNLSLTQGGRISATNFGQGNTGTININASNTISVDGIAQALLPSTIVSVVAPGAIGNSGGINITTSNLSLTKGGQITTSTFGQGNAGAITINASNTISADGVTQAPIPSFISSQIAPGAIGDSGGINLTANNLFLTNGSSVSTSTFGNGNIEEIIIHASDTISVNGTTQAGIAESGIFSTVNSEAKGNSKRIRINSNFLFLDDEALVSTRTEGEGEAGDIFITVKTIEVTNNGQILTNTTNNFNAGDIILDIKDNTLLSGAETGLFAQTKGAGNAGNIKIGTPQITIDQGASISAFTEADGNSGTITVDAPQKVLITNDSELTVETTAAGKPGNIFINTPNLTIGKDSQLSATATATSTNTEGGGSININTSKLDLTGKLGIFAETQGVSPAGTLNIQPYTDQTDLNIKFTDTAILSTLTTDLGAGGDINLTAPETINISGEGKITAETSGDGDAGDINFSTKNLDISNQTEISASTSGNGKAGDINITAAKFNLTEDANLFTNTSSSASAGDIELNITDNINLSNSTIRAGTTKGSTGNGGNIIIDPVIMTIQDGAEIATDSQGSGTGGDITLQAGTLILDQGTINSTTASTQGGNITLNIGENLGRNKCYRRNSPSRRRWR